MARVRPHSSVQAIAEARLRGESGDSTEYTSHVDAAEDGDATDHEARAGKQDSLGSYFHRLSLRLGRPWRDSPHLRTDGLDRNSSDSSSGNFDETAGCKAAANSRLRRISGAAVRAALEAIEPTCDRQRHGPPATLTADSTIWRGAAGRRPATARRPSAAPCCS